MQTSYHKEPGSVCNRKLHAWTICPIPIRMILIIYPPRIFSPESNPHSRLISIRIRLIYTRDHPHPSVSRLCLAAGLHIDTHIPRKFTAFFNKFIASFPPRACIRISLERILINDIIITAAKDNSSHCFSTLFRFSLCFRQSSIRIYIEIRNPDRSAISGIEQNVVRFHLPRQIQKTVHRNCAILSVGIDERPRSGSLLFHCHRRVDFYTAAFSFRMEYPPTTGGFLRHKIK